MQGAYILIILFSILSLIGIGFIIGFIIRDKMPFTFKKKSNDKI